MAKLKFCKTFFEIATDFRGKIKGSFVVTVTIVFLGPKSGKTNDCS